VKAFILIAGFSAAYLSAFWPAIEPAAARDVGPLPARWFRPAPAPRWSRPALSPQWSRPAPPPVRQVPPPPAIAIPQQFSPPQEAYASFPEAPGTTAAGVAPATTEPSPCRLRLGKLAVFKPLPVLVGPGECGAADAVLLESVTLPDDTKVTFAPAATLRCTMAEQVALWLREDVMPASASLGTQMRALEDYDSYECRGQNRVRGATLSEHGRANALDLRGFRLTNGKLVELTDANAAKEWRESLRVSACARFHTVLGPGSDGNHETHIHIDLAERRSGYKICQWDVREPAKVAEKAKLETDEKAKPAGEEKGKPVAEEKGRQASDARGALTAGTRAAAELERMTKPVAEQKGKPVPEAKAPPAAQAKVPPELEKQTKPVADEKAKLATAAKTKPAAETKVLPALEKKNKPLAEEKAKPELEKKASGSEQLLPPPRPSEAPAEKSRLSSAADATQQSRAPAAAAKQTPRHATWRRWRYYRWWW
jgi:hypothetical protein